MASEANHTSEEHEKVERSGDDVSSDGDASKDRGGSMAVQMGAHDEKKAELGNADKYEITEDDCMDELGYSYPNWKKWYILTVIFIVQVQSLPEPACLARHH